MKKFSILFIVILLFMLPAMSLVEGQGLVPCKNVAGDPCEFKDILDLVNNVMDFILVKLSLPIAAIMFAYAGFLMIVPGGESASKRTKAKHIFVNAAIGILLVAGAWLIVNTLLSILGYDGSWILTQ